MSAKQFDPIRIIQAFVNEGVNFVLIGAWSLEAQGIVLPAPTQDVDFTPAVDPQNLERVSSALRRLNAKVRADGDAHVFSHNGESLGRARVWNLTCEWGDFDLAMAPAGFETGFESLRSNAVLISRPSDDGEVSFFAASVADVITSKTSAGRAKDIEVLPTVRQQARKKGLIE